MRFQGYKILKRLGSGSFGTVYLGHSPHTGHHAAIKVERLQGPKKVKVSQILYEREVLATLNRDPRYQEHGIPRLFLGGSHKGKYNFLITELFESDLEHCYRNSREIFTERTILNLSIQFVRSLRFLHSHGFLHRDIKPQNFCVRVSQGHMRVYLIDYGLSKKYLAHGIHIAYRDGKKLTGTPRYASINTQRGIEQSRRDDMESLIYQIVYLFVGKLPWQGIKCSGDRHQKHRQILEKKLSTPLRDLCSKCPRLLVTVLRRVRRLRFTQEPPYRWILKMLENAL